MNKEEIRHFKSLLRQGSLRHMNILLDDKFQSELLSIIKDYELFIRENKILKENAKNNDKVVDKVNWENQLLKKENNLLKDRLKMISSCKYVNECDFLYDCTKEEYKYMADSNVHLTLENERLKEVIDKVNVFLNNHDKNAGKLYYKYNNKYLLSEIKEDIRKILKGGSNG